MQVQCESRLCQVANAWWARHGKAWWLGHLCIQFDVRIQSDVDNKFTPDATNLLSQRDLKWRVRRHPTVC